MEKEHAKKRQATPQQEALTQHVLSVCDCKKDLSINIRVNSIRLWRILSLGHEMKISEYLKLKKISNFKASI